jgi:hypothetical protein
MRLSSGGIIPFRGPVAPLALRDYTGTFVPWQGNRNHEIMGMIIIIVGIGDDILGW